VNRIFARRIPTYLTGFLIGLILVLGVRQIKKAVAPDFHEFKEKRTPISLAKGDSLVLDLGKEPGKVIAWGFPTKLAMGKIEGDRVVPFLALEYRDLVEEKKVLGPFLEEGKYSLLAQFYLCKVPGDKDCMRLQLEQEVVVGGEVATPSYKRELVLNLADKVLELNPAVTP